MHPVLLCQRKKIKLIFYIVLSVQLLIDVHEHEHKKITTLPQIKKIELLGHI